MNTLFSSAYVTVSMTDHILSHETNQQFLKIKLIQILFSDYNKIQLETNYKTVS